MYICTWDKKLFFSRRPKIIPKKKKKNNDLQYGIISQFYQILIFPAKKKKIEKKKEIQPKKVFIEILC